MALQHPSRCIAFVLLLTVSMISDTTVNAFSAGTMPQQQYRATTTTTGRRLPTRTTTSVWSESSSSSTTIAESSSSTTAEVVVDGAKTDDVYAHVYDQLGIEEGKLALGIKPDEVLKYIGTREDLITKTMNDIPSFDRKTAEQEVDKYLMDAEMIDLYIRYEKEIERNPDFVVPETTEEKEGLFSFRTVVILYLAYVGYDTISATFRKYVAQQQLEGTWQPTNIGFIDKWIEDTTEQAMAAAQAAADAATDVVVQNAESIQAVSDSVQQQLQ